MAGLLVCARWAVGIECLVRVWWALVGCWFGVMLLFASDLVFGCCIAVRSCLLVLNSVG